MRPVPNPAGHSATLLPGAPDGNANRLTHGLYSRRRHLPPEALELADDLMRLEHLQAVDRLVAEEAAALIVLIDRIDGVLFGPGTIQRKSKTLLEHRGRLSRHLTALLREIGATPRIRADYAARMAQGGTTLAEEIRARQHAREAAENGGEGPP